VSKIDTAKICQTHQKVILLLQPQLFLPSDIPVGTQHLHNKSNVYILFDTVYALQSYVNRMESRKARVFHLLFVSLILI
jgi:hypothetical protein